MSIIYDALKKLQNSHQQQKKLQEKTTKHKKIYLFFYISIVILGIIIAKYIFDFFNISLTTKLETKQKINLTYQIQGSTESLSNQSSFKEETKPEINKDTFQISELKLTGILYDPVSPFAIINSRILKKGECIKGACIEEIFEDKVKLNFKGENIELNLKD